YITCGYFPARYKESNVIVLRKAGKSLKGYPTLARSYVRTYESAFRLNSSSKRIPRRAASST
ncbi:hypothetical protein L249_7093, partial [Ophiocordyceps polyrhachis-furcata BCC 54312]